MDRRAVVVALGGIAGAVVRWLVGEVIDDAVVTVLVVNTVGTGLLGAFIGRARRGPPARELLVTVGFCGGLTTFSAFAVEVARRLDDGRAVDGLGIMAASLLLGFLAFVAGSTATRART